MLTENATIQALDKLPQSYVQQRNTKELFLLIVL